MQLKTTFIIIFFLLSLSLIYRVIPTFFFSSLPLREERLFSLFSLYFLIYHLIIIFINFNNRDKTDKIVVSVKEVIILLILSIIPILFSVSIFFSSTSFLLSDFTNAVFEYVCFFVIFSLPIILFFSKKLQKYFIFVVITITLSTYYFYIYKYNSNYEAVFKKQGIECTRKDEMFFYGPFEILYIKEGDEIPTLDNKKEISKTTVSTFCKKFDEETRKSELFFLIDNQIYKHKDETK